MALISMAHFYIIYSSNLTRFSSVVFSRVCLTTFTCEGVVFEQLLHVAKVAASKSRHRRYHDFAAFTRD
jgi:hypothetical protein